MKVYPLNIKFIGITFIQRLQYSYYYLYEVIVAPNVKYYKIISTKLDSYPYRLVVSQHEANALQNKEDSRRYTWYASSLDAAIQKFMEITKTRE